MAGFHGTIDINGFDIFPVLDFLDFCFDLYQTYGLDIFCTEFTRDKEGKLLWYKPIEEKLTDNGWRDWELASVEEYMAERYPLLNVNVDGHAAVFEYSNPHIAVAVRSYVHSLPEEVDKVRFLEEIGEQVLNLNMFLLVNVSQIAGTFDLQPTETWVTLNQRDTILNSSLSAEAISAFRDLCLIPKTLQSGTPSCSQVFILIDNLLERFLKSVIEISPSKRLSFPVLLEMAHERQLISNEQLQVSKRLHGTRNRIQHQKAYQVDLMDTRKAFYVVLGIMQSISHWMMT